MLDFYSNIWGAAPARQGCFFQRGKEAESGLFQECCLRKKSQTRRNGQKLHQNAFRKQAS